MAATQLILSLASDASLDEGNGIAGIRVEAKLHAEYDHQCGTLDVMGALRAAMCAHERNVHQA